MDHGAVIEDHERGARRPARTAVLLALTALLVTPAAASAAASQPAAPTTPASATATAATAPVGATLVQPADGHHFDHLERAPMVQFDPGKDASGVQEAPKWVLLASDPAMKTTVRYCRYFVWASAGDAFHWGCNRWATGVDQLGNDQLLALEPGKVYYWQVVSKATSGTGEVKSAIRSFALDAEQPEPSIQGISDHITGEVFDDGSQLNLGAAALVNSGVRVSKIASTQLAPFAFRIRLAHVGAVDYSRSYVKVTSAAGTRYVRVSSAGAGSAGAVWRLTPAERRLRVKRFTYQGFLRSTKNGAVVRSQVRVVLIRAKPKPPAWKPD